MVTYTAIPKLEGALTQFADYVRAETLADVVAVGQAEAAQAFEFDGETFTVGVARR